MLAINAQPRGSIALWIEIDNQYRLSDCGQGRPEIDRGRRLPDPALLISDNEDSHLVLIFHSNTPKRKPAWYHSRERRQFLRSNPFDCLQASISS